MSLPLCVLALTIGTAIGAARGSCRCASALAVLAPVWLLGNGPMEGAVLWTMDSDHGLTCADLLAIPMAALAAWRLWRSVEVRAWLASRAEEVRLPTAAPHRVSLTHAGGRGPTYGPRSAARLTKSGAVPSARTVTTARGAARRPFRRRSGPPVVRLSTGGPGGASGD